MSDIQFVVGVFQEFRAKVGFHLGRLSHDPRRTPSSSSTAPP